jgi:hypothetical protein
MSVLFRSLCLVVATGVLCCLGAASVAAASPAKDAAVMEGVHTLHVGIQSYAIDHHDRFPRFGSNRRFRRVLRGYIDNWPRNPYRDRAMRSRFRHAGDFTYRVSDDRKRFFVVGWGQGGVRLVRVP